MAVAVLALVAAAALVATVLGALAGGRLDEPSGAAPTDAATAAAPRPSTTAPDPRPTTTTAPPACDRRDELDAGVEPVPAELRARVDAALAHPGWSGLDRSVSVWVEGYGEVAAVDPDRALLPASNQKLLTAVGVHLLLDPAERFRTEVRRAGDELVLRAGGDPTLRARGAHSLQALAAEVARAGVGAVSGLRVDATVFEAATSARGWQDWQVPTYVGPMSGLVVDDNRGRTDGAYLADPALGNGAAFARALGGVGVTVPAPVVHGAADPLTPVVAAVESAPVGELTRSMLQRSDNEIAESLLRRVGDGSTDVGLARIAEALEPWCLHLRGESGDGSGLSRADHRSAREWRRVLQVALEQPWGPELRDALPVAGVSGTLAGRLGGPTTAGRVQAKTGTIIGGAALSGYATTGDGRLVVFSVVENGEPGAASRGVASIDAVVRAVVGA